MVIGSGTDSASEHSGERAGAQRDPLSIDDAIKKLRSLSNLRDAREACEMGIQALRDQRDLDRLLVIIADCIPMTKEGIATRYRIADAIAQYYELTGGNQAAEAVASGRNRGSEAQS